MHNLRFQSEMDPITHGLISCKCTLADLAALNWSIITLWNFSFFRVSTWKNCFEIPLAPSEIPVNQPDQFSLSGQIFLQQQLWRGTWNFKKKILDHFSPSGKNGQSPLSYAFCLLLATPLRNKLLCQLFRALPELPAKQHCQFSPFLGKWSKLAVLFRW